jgi:hypothetical protein
MHTLVLLITEERPTPGVIDKAMKPFFNEDGYPYDWYGLGGRFSGLLEPISPDEAIVGSDAAPEFETHIKEIMSGRLKDGWSVFGPPDGAATTIHTPSSKGTGADACQIGNIANIGALQCSALINDHGLHKCPVFPMAQLLAALGPKGDTRPALEIAQENRVATAWDALVLAILETTPPERWVSVLDCHS